MAMPKPYEDMGVRRRVSSVNYMSPGDLLFDAGKGAMSYTIQAGTLSLPNVGPLGKWGWAGMSHVAIVAKYHGELLVYESTSKYSRRPPCKRTGRLEPSGVQAHTIDEFLKGSTDVWHAPLRAPLYADESERLTAILEMHLGSEYDFLGAGWAWGGPVRRMIQAAIRPQNLDLLFCSELCMAALAGVGRLQTKSASVWSPTQLHRRCLRMGICGRGGLLQLKGKRV
jgi:hypothetical protein